MSISGRFSRYAYVANVPTACELVSSRFLSQQVFKVDVKRDLIFVVGGVPGPKNGYLRVRDAVRKPCVVLNARAFDGVADCCRRFTFMKPPPFPTFVAPASETPDTVPSEIVGEHGTDPFADDLEDE